MNKLLKKRIVRGGKAFVLLCAVSVLLCAGCERKSHEPPAKSQARPKSPGSQSQPAASSQKEFTIGVLYWSMNIPGQVAMRKGLEAQAEAINNSRGDSPGIKLIVHVAGDGEEGMERQIRQMYELIEQKVDLIIVQPTDIAALGKPLGLANKNGIPVVAYDQYIIGGNLAAYVTSDNYQAGYLDGEYIASKYDNEKRIRIVLVEYPHVSSTVQRVNGFLDALYECGQNFEILETYEAVEPVGGKEAGKNILHDFPVRGSLDVVFTVNDGGGLSVVDALTRAKRTEIMVATIDGDPDSVEIIRSGGITVIDSAQFCGPMGAQALKKAYDILLGKKVSNHVLIPVFPITRETLDLYTGWMGPIPQSFKKSWESKYPYWEGKIKIVEHTGLE